MVLKNNLLFIVLPVFGCLLMQDLAAEDSELPSQIRLNYQRRTAYKGRLEFMNPTTKNWGVVCVSEGFRLHYEAAVVCRQLGYTRAITVSTSYSSRILRIGNYLLKTIKCIGTEDAISQCPSTWEYHSCRSRQLVTITCSIHRLGWWRTWSDWESCSASCGQGEQMRSRTCSTSTCRPPDENVQVQNCTMAPCPIDGGWTAWSEWSPSSVSCNFGLRWRSRECTDPAPEHDGRWCFGPSHEFSNCSTHTCPVDGGWSDWTLWSQCSVTCSTGIQQRSRTCSDPEPESGGLPCRGGSQENITCYAGQCPVDGVWTEWSGWTDCSVTCGSGELIRLRTCTAPTYGGQNCTGENEAAESCDMKECPVDGGWSDWTVWGNCTSNNSSDDYIMSRFRECNNPPPAHQGHSCEGKVTETAGCVVVYLNSLSSQAESNTHGSPETWFILALVIFVATGLVCYVGIKYCKNPKNRNAFSRIKFTLFPSQQFNSHVLVNEEPLPEEESGRVSIYRDSDDSREMMPS